MNKKPQETEISLTKTKYAISFSEKKLLHLIHEVVILLKARKFIEIFFFFLGGVFKRERLEIIARISLIITKSGRKLHKT